MENLEIYPSVKICDTKQVTVVIIGSCGTARICMLFPDFRNRLVIFLEIVPEEALAKSLPKSRKTLKHKL